MTLVSRKTADRLGGPTDTLEAGIALVIALIALSLFSLLGLYLALNSSTELRISDNFETKIQARFAAQAGLNHARDLLRGLDFSELLKGPDGSYDTSGGYMSQAYEFSFRNPVSWSSACTLDILDPSSDVSGIPDDGLISTGRLGAANGTVLIPLTGIAHTVANPNGSGTVTLSRYFVKVTDNNGEASELARDGSNNPFTDGDGIVIVRSIGVAQTIRENTTAKGHRNSVVVCEARFKRYSTFRVGAAIVVQGTDVQAASALMFDGSAFSIDGEAGIPGIGAIDANIGDTISPAGRVLSQVAGDQQANIRGMGLIPSIKDISAPVSADADQSLLLNKDYLWNFVNGIVPQFADNVYQGSQNWTEGIAPDIGVYDTSMPWNDPLQRPKVTYVNGDLSVSGDIRGGGLLVVTGKFSAGGGFEFNGLVLIVGKGELDLDGSNPGIRGGIYLASINNSGGSIDWGIARLTLSKDTSVRFDSRALEMAIRLIPPAQLSFREVTEAMDP